MARSEFDVGVIDYESGNLLSVVNALESIGASALIIDDEEQLNACSHLVLPGVGAFGFCLQKLKDSGISDAVHRWAIEERRPLLGICVGMQLMADTSQEHGIHQGLGWMGGDVLPLERSEGVRVPHVGWNEVTFTESFGSFEKGCRADFYFDHSYAYGAPTHGKVIGQCLHGREFSVVLRRDNIVATQFHPEKSQQNGLRLLTAFLELS